MQTETTAVNENRFGNEFTLERTYDDNLEIVETFNDGSSSSLIFDPDYEYRVVRCGRDETVMVERTYNDGSTRTMNVPTAWFESIRPALEPYF